MDTKTKFVRNYQLTMAHHHRSSGLKQSNKSHKSNRASKRSINRAAGGKVQRRNNIKKKGNGINTIVSKAKADRLNMAKQRRLASREKLLQQKRVQGRLNIRNEDSSIVPRVVGIISLSESEAQLENKVRSFLVDGSDKSVGNDNATASITAFYSKFKKEGYLTFLTNSTAFSSFYNATYNEEDCAVQAALDLCQVCDAVMFLVDGRDAHKQNNINGSVEGMEIGGASVTTGVTNGQDYDHLISSRGERVLSAIKAQGLPTPLTVLVNFEGDADADDLSLSSFQSMKSIKRSALKKKLSLRKYLCRFAETEFGEGSEKVLEIDIPDIDEDDCEMNIDTKNTLILGKSKKIIPDVLLNTNNDAYPSRASCVRTLCTMSASPPKWVSEMPRSYILSDNNGVNGGYEYDPSTKELRIKGYVRGQAPWNVNNLVHVPNVGTFGVKHIERHEPSLQKRKIQNEMSEDSEKEILATVDINKRESLDMFANPDALDGEQNLIGFEDDDHNYEDEDDASTNDDKAGFKKGTARPAGWSDYQSAWLEALGEDGEKDGEEMEDPFDHGELAFELNKKKDDATITNNDMDEEDANNVSIKERQILLEQRKKDQEDEMMFPDEVEVKEDENARDRFARYRSLKSFRKSYWDPKENLPDSYATIYHFSSFKATQGDVMADMKDIIEASGKALYVKNNNSDPDVEMDCDGDKSYDEDILDGCIPSGSFVSLVVEGVSQSNFVRMSESSLLTAVSLLPHENKVSVLHMNLSQTTQCDFENNDLPVKSKDVILLRCGWRKWEARPIFSQNNLNCDKHKFERFMPTNGAFFSSAVLGPVTYTPCPVLLFRKNDDKKSQFVALGSIFNADADRIVVKRIILTGYPTRVHKRHATVKYMFYNPDDVKVCR